MLLPILSFFNCIISHPILYQIFPPAVPPTPRPSGVRGRVPRPLSVLLLDGNAEVIPAESAATEDGGALNVLAGRKDGNAAELAVADAFVAVLQHLDTLAELLAHDLKLRKNVR